MAISKFTQDLHLLKTEEVSIVYYNEIINSTDRRRHSLRFETHIQSQFKLTIDRITKPHNRYGDPLVSIDGSRYIYVLTLLRVSLHQTATIAV